MKSFGLTEFQGDRPLVRVAVKDDGGGIPGDVLNRLTTAQVTTKVRGNGVGMVVISEIVNRARGLLTIRSTPGLGTEVEILLPAREAKSASS
jgi:nitrogen-specific signal transduction histidine kinase